MPALLPMLVVLAAMQHDITNVAPVAPDAAIATPVPGPQQRRLKKYDMPELAGAQQALGSQLIDGHLPKPLIDFVTVEGSIRQRISIFEGGLVVVKMTGASTIDKKVLLPPDALTQYTQAVSAKAIGAIDARELITPEPQSSAMIRVYEADGTFVERRFHPNRIPPKALNDQVAPLRDLLRAISEDRGVTTSIAGYIPKPGDELVADDHKTWRVTRVVDGAGVVELRCLDAPTTIYVKTSDIHLYFMGTKPHDE